jgi:hypothetical protein
MKLHLPNKIIFAILAVLVIAGWLFVAYEYKQIKAPVEQNPPANAEIVVSSPSRNAEVSSPIHITGKALGSWFFEASFPVKVLDEDGTVLGQAPIKALTDWMQSGFVDFDGSVVYSKPKGQKGALLFENDNPSGLPANHKEYRLPIIFSSVVTKNPAGTCAPDLTDCNGDPKLCLDMNKNLACN